MKFGKSLSNQIEETLPEWRDKFLSYKELKKQLKLIRGAGERNKRPRLADEKENDSSLMTKEEMDFIRLLEAELEKFNSFFVDKEEEYIIRQKVFIIFPKKGKKKTLSSFPPCFKFFLGGFLNFLPRVGGVL